MREWTLEFIENIVKSQETEANRFVKDCRDKKLAEGWTSKRNKSRSESERKTLDQLSRKYIREKMRNGEIVFSNSVGKRVMKIDGL